MRTDLLPRRKGDSLLPTEVKPDPAAGTIQRAAESWLHDGARHQPLAAMSRPPVTEGQACYPGRCCS